LLLLIVVSDIVGAAAGVAVVVAVGLFLNLVLRGDTVRVACDTASACAAVHSKPPPAPGVHDDSEIELN
jgi:hypothetical protein